MEKLHGVKKEEDQILDTPSSITPAPCVTSMFKSTIPTNVVKSDQKDSDARRTTTQNLQNITMTSVFAPLHPPSGIEDTEPEQKHNLLVQVAKHDEGAAEEIVVEKDNGCEEKRLYGNIILRLHSKVENLHLGMTASDEVSAQPERASTNSTALENGRTNQRQQNNDNNQTSQTDQPQEKQPNQNHPNTFQTKSVVETNGRSDTISYDSVIEKTNTGCSASTDIIEGNSYNVHTANGTSADVYFPSNALHPITSSMHTLSSACTSSSSLERDSPESGLTPRHSASPTPLTNTGCTKVPRRWQPPLLKSQSLDYYNDHTLIYTMPQHVLFQLPELNESRSLDVQQQTSAVPRSANVFPTVDSAKAGCRSLDNTFDSFESESADKPVDFGSRSLQKPNVTSKLQSIESRPIYPNVPYSPYASPYGSPRSNRRRPPLRESRRISIEQSGSFLQLNQYKLMDQIGQGSYGLVKLAYSEEDSTHYAMKILSKRRLLRQAGLMRRGPKKTTSPLDRVYREIAVLKKLDHPNVVKLVEVLDDPMEDSLYMVFELVKQGEVLSIPTDAPLTEERAWSVFRDTLLGLEYLHYQRIIHGDLKPGNLLLTECGHVKIADLGVCNEFLGEDATMSNGSTAGTPAFRAPESLNIGQNMFCGKAADIWALGATLYSLVFGNVPFAANSIPVLYDKIKHELLTFPPTPKVSTELEDCIRSMLIKDPAKRATLPQLKEHTWVTAGGLHSLPTEDENCRLVQISDDDINSVVRSIPKLDTLILIKTMLKKHSFGNPFAKSVSGRAPQRGGSRLERFVRAGRSNSAPGAYNLAIDRQFSGDNLLPSLSEIGPSPNNEES